MKQPTIALGLIVRGTKDEAPLLKQCLENVHKHVDGIFIDFNHPKDKKVAKELIDIAKEYNVDYKEVVWGDNFVEARNNNLDRIPSSFDWYLWLDSDDTVDKPDELHKIVAVANKSQQGIFVKYNYAHDEFGNVTVSHYVARLVRHNGSYRWKSSIDDEGIAVHETLSEIVTRSKAACDDFAIEHHADPTRSLQSLERNIRMLEAMYDKQTENGKIDPRTLFYLATHYYDAGVWDKTKELLELYLQMSGWAEERCEALVYLGNIMKMQGKVDAAHHAYLLALGEYQNSPRPYIELAKIDFTRKRFEESASWIEKCLQLPPPATTMVMRPMENTFDAYVLAAQAYVNIGGKKLDEAMKYIKKALELRPLDDGAQQNRDFIEKLVEQREDIRAAMRITRTFKDESKIVPFLDTLPYEVQDNPLVLTTRFAHTPPKKWGEKSIAIYCGQGPLGIWGPWSLEDGIGGSEEAVIQLSRELAELGWLVTVYATPGERAGNDANVLWKQYYEFNPKDEYNILVVWRNPSFFDSPVKAKKKYLWLHDVMDKEEFTKDRLDNLDSVIFVGQYHADYYQGVIPEEKWFVSGNGIDPKAFEEADGKFERVKNRLIYMSSYERGLPILLKNWKKIRKAVPDATLLINYGWDSFDAGNKDNPERMEWKRQTIELMKQPGITEGGRIGHQQIVEEINKADILAYPCTFPEVYCITYIKAMAGGAVPVTTDFAELGYYQGIHSHLDLKEYEKSVDDYIDLLIKTMRLGDLSANRQVLKEHARKCYSWNKTARMWSDNFTL